jgi:AraC-like DNA-binding protein
MAQWSRAGVVKTMTAHANSLTKRATTTATRPSPPLTEPALNFRTYVDALARLGFQVDVLLRDAGVPRSALDDPDGRIPCATIGAILNRALSERRVESLGMRIAIETPIGAFPLIDYLVLSSETAGHALEQLARYFRLVASAVALEFRHDKETIRVSYEGPSGSMQYEFGITLCLLHLRRETDKRFRAESVSLVHRPDNLGDMEEVLGSPVRPGAAWNGWTMTREMWNLPLRRRDPILRGLLEQQASDMLRRLPAIGGAAFEVRQALVSRVVGGDTRIEAVARDLAVSVRSLQRRLSAEGHSYHALVDETRKEAAGQYLIASSMSIGEVGFLLGYSEAAAFHRAFKRWSGMTPQDFRRQHRSDS